MEYGKWWYIHIAFILDLFEVSYSIVSRNLMPFYMCKHSQYVPSPGPGRINIGYRPSAYESILYPNMFFSDGKQEELDQKNGAYFVIFSWDFPVPLYKALYRISIGLKGLCDSDVFKFTQWGRMRHRSTHASSEILIKMRSFSWEKTHLKISSAKHRPFCFRLNLWI